MPQDMVEIKKEKYEEGCCVPSDGDHYPYGTSLTLRDDLIEDLGVGALTVGDMVEVRALAVVTSKSEREDEDTNGVESEKRLEIQLTQIKVRREGEDRVKQLYGG
jgi:hypothetical protein